MTLRFERVAVLGLGLLGGSVAMAARTRGIAACVVGATRRRDVLETALRSGAIDEAAGFDEAVDGADLVVLATPVFAMDELLRSVAPRLRQGALVTDVGSVKATLAETLPGLLPRGAHYVGAHPMAGGHQRGFEHARADLFEGAPCIVGRDSDVRARDRVCDFWRSLGARVVLRDATDHDAEVAWMSHVPHVLAFAFARALAGAPAGAHEVAGSGFRDFTRIAQSDPELWGEILTANRKAIGAPLQAAGAALAELGRVIDANDAEAVERWIARARSQLAPAPAEQATAGRGVRRSHPSAVRPNPRPSTAASRGRRSDNNS